MTTENDKEYSKMLEKLFSDYRIKDLNEKIRALNVLFDKGKNANLIYRMVSDPDDLIKEHDQKLAELKKLMKDKNGYGGLTETIKKTVKSLKNSKFSILDIMSSGIDAKQASVASILKRWAKDENDTTGIKVYKTGSGRRPIIYEKREG